MAEKSDFVVLAAGCLNAMRRCCVDVPEVHSDLKSNTGRLETLLQNYGFKAGDTYIANISNRITSAKLFVDSRELLLRFCDKQDLSKNGQAMFDVIDKANLMTTESEVEV